MENRYYMCCLWYQVGKFQEWKLSLSFQAKTIRYFKTFHFIIYSFWFQLNRWGKVTFGSTSMQKDQIRSVSNRNSVSVVIDGISTRNFSSFLEMHIPRSTSLYCHICGSLYFFISIFSNIYIKYNKRKKESKRTHRFSVITSSHCALKFILKNAVPVIFLKLPLCVFESRDIESKFFIAIK